VLAERTFDTGEILINYAESATASSPLVLLHGLTVHWESLQALIPPLTQAWHIYACDLRGHGKSGWAKSGYRVVDFVPDTTMFIQQHIGQPTVLLGFSISAIVALIVAMRLPKLIRALVLLEPILFCRNASVHSFQATEVYKWLTWVYETVSSAHTAPEIIAKCKDFSPEMSEVDALNMATMIHHVDPAAVATLLNDETFAGLDLVSVMQNVTCPTLFLYGEPDKGSLVRAEDIDFMRVNLPQSAAIQVKNAGHSLDWQESETVLAHITTFLNTL